jgi:hypothetical protein
MRYIKIPIAIMVILAFISAGTVANSYKKPKNLKLLPKDISDERLDSIMQSYNKALGVCCGFCHVEDKKNNIDYSSDANPVKEQARKMLQMTIDINKTYFNTDSTIHPAYLNIVSCNTCHKGDAYPQ